MKLGFYNRKSFWILFGIPNILSIIYFLIIATPKYVSESSLIVYQANQGASDKSVSLQLSQNGGGVSLEGDYMLESYLKSWNGFAGQDRQALADHWRSGDFVSRFGGLVTAFRTTPTVLWHYFAGNVTTKIDNESAILTLSVVGYDPHFVKQLADSVLLSSGRALNLINQQAYKTTEDFFAAQIIKDRATLRSDIDQLSVFQRTHKIVDPAAAYNSQLELLNQFKSKLAALTAQAKVVQATTPNSVEVQNLAIQSQAAEQEIKQVQKAVSDGPGALTQVSGEFAFLQSAIKNDDAGLAIDQEQLLRAHQSGLQNRYYFQFISAPTMPVDSTEPRSAVLIASIMAATFFLYVIIK